MRPRTPPFVARHRNGRDAELNCHSSILGDYYVEREDQGSKHRESERESGEANATEREGRHGEEACTRQLQRISQLYFPWRHLLLILCSSFCWQASMWFIVYGLRQRLTQPPQLC